MGTLRIIKEFKRIRICKIKEANADRKILAHLKPKAKLILR